MTVEERIYKALTASETLLAMLADGKNSIYAKRSDDAGTYPVIVITLVSAVPFSHADDVMTAYRTVHRISVLTAHGANAMLRNEVYRVMTGAGFQWQDTNEVHDDDSYVLSMDFEYVEVV